MSRSLTLDSCWQTPRVPRALSRIAGLLLLLGVFLASALPAQAACVDVDGDDFGAFGDPSCPGGTTPDCDDGDASVYPGKVIGPSDVANGVDNDCNGLEECYADFDGDTFGDESMVVIDDNGDFLCLDFGEASNATDCDDVDASVYPGKPIGPSDVANGVDNDCSGLEECYEDTDVDTFGSTSIIDDDGNFACVDAGEASSSTDCDDGDASVYPGKVIGPSDVANGVDNDCSGLEECYEDTDVDTFGSTSIIDDDGNFACVDAGEASSSTDCDDGDASINPSATEICDGLDNNCVGGIDEGAVCEAAVPALSPLGMVTLLLMLGMAGAWGIRRTR